LGLQPYVMALITIVLIRVVSKSVQTIAKTPEGELRLRMVDARKLNPQTIMPPYFVVDGMNRVAPPFRGKPILTAEQIEDVVAFLATLRD